MIKSSLQEVQNKLLFVISQPHVLQPGGQVTQAIEPSVFFTKILSVGQENAVYVLVFVPVPVPVLVEVVVSNWHFPLANINFFSV